MAAQHNISITPTTFNAAVDFSACATTLYRAVRAGSVAGEVALANGASNPYAFGVLQNTPSPGQGAALVLLGPTKMAGRTTATCTLKFGRLLAVASDGFFEPPSVPPGSAISAMWLGPNFTTAGGSIVGEGMFYGLTACAVSAC